MRIFFTRVKKLHLKPRNSSFLYLAITTETICIPKEAKVSTHALAVISHYMSKPMAD